MQFQFWVCSECGVVKFETREEYYERIHAEKDQREVLNSMVDKAVEAAWEKNRWL